MELNISPEFMLSTIGSVPLLISTIVLLRKFHQTRDRILGYLSLAWFSFFLALFIDGISYLLLDDFLFRVKFIFILFIGIFSILAVDLMELQRIKAWSIILGTGLGSISTVLAFHPGYVFYYVGPDGYPSIGSSGALRLFSIMSTLFYAFYFFLFSYKLMQAAEGKYKRITKIHLLGILTYGPMTVPIILLGVTFRIPGVHAIFIGFGTLLSTVTLARNPEIMYIMPFKVGSLNFVTMGSGLVPFRYQWNKTPELKIDDLLFGSLFEALRQFSKEAFPFGSIKEVIYEKGVLYVSLLANQNTMVILIADRKSDILMQNLQSFTNSFQRLIKAEGINLHRLTENNRTKISDLVKQSFPLIPNLDE